MLKRGRKLGVRTTPAVRVRPSSGVRFRLPRDTRRVPWELPPVSRSLNPVELTPAGWNSSLRFGARISDESVPRKRTESTTCQLSPIFQDSTASKVEYLVQR